MRHRKPKAWNCLDVTMRCRKMCGPPPCGPCAPCPPAAGNCCGPVNVAPMMPVCPTYPFAQVCMTVPPPCPAPLAPVTVKPLQLPCTPAGRSKAILPVSHLDKYAEESNILEAEYRRGPSDALLELLQQLQHGLESVGQTASKGGSLQWRKKRSLLSGRKESGL